MDKCEIIKDYGKIGEKKDRLGKMCDVRICKVSWHGRTPTYDIRQWGEESAPLKGISLDWNQLKELKGILNEMQEL